ncbi:unnamed protein product [Adineta ricciae]|uniref:Uncharacterized protein n=1 Tax=Adineta ricciae TaxID=249248 RepID=A0A813MDM7_ADIRI|nr:unnamed protein product [Adineta ricciae]
MSVLDIGNLFEALSEETSIRPLSVLVCLSFVYFGISWRDIDLFLKAIGGLTAKTCKKWSTDIIEQDFEEFLQDNRGEETSKGKTYFLKTIRSNFERLSMSLNYTYSDSAHQTASYHIKKINKKKFAPLLPVANLTFLKSKKG